MIAAITSLNSGLGTTTVAAHLAQMLAYSAPTVLVDATADLGATTWNRNRRIFADKSDYRLSVVRLSGQDLATELSSLQSAFPNVIVDAGGASIETQEAVLESSDRVIYSTQFDNQSLRSLRQLLILTAHVRNKHPLVPARAFFTNVIVRTNSVASGRARQYLNDVCGLQAFDFFLPKRKIYRTHMGLGWTVVDDAVSDYDHIPVEALAEATLKMVPLTSEPSTSARSQSPRHCHGSFVFSSTSQVPSLIQHRFSG